MNNEEAMLNLIRNLEAQIQTGFQSVARTNEKLEKGLNHLMDRIEKVENNQASAGLIKPSAMLTGLVACLGLIMTLVTGGATLSAAWVSAQTGKRAAEEKAAYLEHQRDVSERQHESTLSALERQFDRDLDQEKKISQMQALLSSALRN